MKYVITGAPGSGKTSVINALAAQGHATLPEVARAIIAEEQQKPNPVIPQTDLAGFQSLVMARQCSAEADAPATTCFLDRSLVDCLAYTRLGGIDVPEGFAGAVRAAKYSAVFILDRLPAYEKDAQRHEDNAHAHALHDALWDAYTGLGFDVVRVPYLPAERAEDGIALRAAFILAAAGQSHHREYEAKFCMEHHSLHDRLREQGLEQIALIEQHDHYYPAPSGSALRLRLASASCITIKGPDRGTQIADRFEYEVPLPSPLVRLLAGIFPGPVQVQKTRAVYRGPYSRTHVALDVVRGLGEFVEIEGPAASVPVWQERLGIHGERVRSSYRELVEARA